MPQIVFDFQKVVNSCLHDQEIKFTNAINQELASKNFIAELFQILKFACQEIKIEELFQQEHFHFVKSPYIKKKIEKLVDNPYFDYNRLCQIPVSKEARLYGNLKKIKHSDFYRFQVLIFDPNHLIYNDQNFNKLKNLTCLFSEKDCSETKKLGKKRK